MTGLPATLPCSSGLVNKVVNIPADQSTKVIKYKLSLSVVGTKTVKAKAIKLTVPAKPPAPSIASINPSSGPTAGGTTVTLTGTGDR